MDIIYKNSEAEEVSFIGQIHKANTSYWKKNISNEHELIKSLTNNPNLSHYNNLLFYHWYERRYNINIINKNVLRSLNEVINVTKKDLHDDVRDRMLEYMNSTKFEGFTIYYQYYHDFFPEIEKFDFAEFNGQEFITYLLKLFPNCIEIDYLSKKRFIRFSGKKLREIEEHGRMVLYYKTNRLPSFYPHFHDSIKFYTHSPHQFLEKNRKEIENIIRSEKSLPKIGEGWISETILYYQIKEAFPDFEVTQHSSPHWLGLQHLDIYFPKLNIAIEYQGKQHTEPVEFFGGHEAFLKNLERDERKRILCEQNETKLFYVFPETDTLRFIEELKEFINKIK